MANQYFQRRSIMGGRSEGEGDAIAFIHAADALPWAQFLRNKLLSENYKIHSFLHNDPNQNYIAELFSSTQACAVLVSPFLLEPQHSVFWKRCAERFHQRTVLLFLGVDQDELRSSLGTSLTECALSCQWLEVDGSREAVGNALVKLIEVFEATDICLQSLHEDSAGHTGDEQSDTEDDVYNIPPPRSLQKNSVVQVMPAVLYESDSREVLVLLEREVDGRLTMMIESGSGPSRHVGMARVVSSAYLATLPSDIVGKVDFTILSENEHIVGTGSLHVHSRLEQLRSLLQKVTSPVTVLCKVMGLSGARTSEADELDTLLARRLAFSQLPPGLKNVLYSEIEAATDQGSGQWPSLLHFAAEFNLTRVCEELLQYPGIIHAACTENCEGMFPCQLAEKNGFTALQHRLVQFVEDMRLRRSAADSGISFSETPPPPSPHCSQSHIYVNERQLPQDVPESTDEDYIDMSTKKFYGYAKPRSYSEGCVRTPYAKTPSEASIVEEDSKDTEPPPLEPKLGRAKSTASDYVAAGHFLSANRCPELSSTEALDSQEVKAEENGSQSSTETLTHSESGATSESEQKSEEREEQGERVSWSVGPPTEPHDRPVSQASSISSQSDCDVPIGAAGSPIDDSPMLRTKNKRGKSVQDKISHFFKKIRTPRRLHSSSESDLPTKGQKKTKLYTRQSTTSTHSDPSGYLSSSFKSSGGESERDSGAVCDEPGSVTLRSKGKNSSTSRNTGKRNGISMQRRVSLRVQRAQNEDLSETPTLPFRESATLPKETFVSFIK